VQTLEPRGCEVHGPRASAESANIPEMVGRREGGGALRWLGIALPVAVFVGHFAVGPLRSHRLLRAFGEHDQSQAKVRGVGFDVPADSVSEGRDHSRDGAIRPKGNGKHVDPLSKLKVRDTLVVTFQEEGCFGTVFQRHSREFTFRRRGARKLTVSMVGSDLNPEYTTPTVLSKTQIAGLETLLDNYRYPSTDGGCATISDHVSFVQERDGKPIATEEFTNGDCRRKKEMRSSVLDELAGPALRREPPFSEFSPYN
jgi:hypothetical protein